MNLFSGADTDRTERFIADEVTGCVWGNEDAHSGIGIVPVGTG